MLLIIGILLFVLILPLLFDGLVSLTTLSRCYKEIEQLPSNSFGLIPGTRKTMRNGNINRYYKYRIEGAARLFHAGKTKTLIVSGHRAVSPEGLYDEPGEMLEDLVLLGVPKEKIITDRSGDRTIDSIRFALRISDGTMTIISQRFHNQRSVFIAQALGMSAIGYDVQDVPFCRGLKTRIREIFARMRMIIDLTKQGPAN